MTRHLYDADVAEILGCLQELEEDYRQVMVVGHNPDLELLLETLTGAYHRLPTGALVHLKVPVDRWLDLNPETEGTLQRIWRPRELE